MAYSVYMGRKGMDEAYGFSLDVINEIRRAIDESKLKDYEVCAAADMSRDYFYKRMKGERPFNTNDVSKIADVLGMDAFIILRRAASAEEVRNALRDERGPVVFSSDDLVGGTLTDQEAEARADAIAANPDDYGVAANHDPNKELERETPRDE